MKSSRQLPVALFILNFLVPIQAQADERTLLLHEMTRVEVEAYLNKEDMVIIPLGSIEQHGFRKFIFLNGHGGNRQVWRHTTDHE